MSRRPLVTVIFGAALAAAGLAQPAQAQSAPRWRGAHPRIEINPRPLLYRRCAVRYVLQPRPSGTVLFPLQHCWWVRG